MSAIAKKAVDFLIQSAPDRDFTPDMVDSLQTSVDYCVDAARKYFNEETISKLPPSAWAHLACAAGMMPNSERKALIAETVLHAALAADAKPKLQLVK